MKRRFGLFSVVAGLGLVASTSTVPRLVAPPGPPASRTPSAQSTPLTPAAPGASDPAIEQPATPVEAAPTAPSEAAPPRPGPDYMWIEGRWVWRAPAKKYEWQPGYWQRVPRLYLARDGAPSTSRSRES